MNRRGDGKFLRDLFKKLRERIPGLVLRTSVITGLPGEGEEEFAELCEFLKEQRLERVGAFPFSPEEGTPAAEMEDVISPEEKKRNFDRMLEVQDRISKEKNLALEGRVMRVLVEGKSKNNDAFLAGKTEGGKTVNFQGDDSLIGNFAQVEITDAKTWSLVGKIV